MPALREAARVEPDIPEHHVDLAEALVQYGTPGAAIAALEEGLAALEGDAAVEAALARPNERGASGRLEGSLTDATERAGSSAESRRDASSPSRSMLCVSDIVESIGPLARSEGAPRSPRRVCTLCVRSPRSIDPPVSIASATEFSLSSEPSPARPFARRAAGSATIVPVVSRRPSTAAIVAGSVPAAAVGRSSLRSRRPPRRPASAAAASRPPSRSSWLKRRLEPRENRPLWLSKLIPAARPPPRPPPRASAGMGRYRPAMASSMRSSALKRLFLSAPKMSMSSSRSSTSTSFASVMKQKVLVSRSIDRRFSGAVALEAPGGAAGIFSSVTSSRPLGRRREDRGAASAAS